MTSIGAYIRHLLSTDTVLYECRNCGKTLDDPERDCPACGETETAEFDILD